jgi:hypothetical protein
LVGQVELIVTVTGLSPVAALCARVVTAELE